MLIFEVIFELESAQNIAREDKEIALKNLIIPDEDRQILTAVTRRHIHSKANSLFSDFIHGKGEGLILLLHGKSSTSTVTSVSNPLQAHQVQERHLLLVRKP